MPRFAARLATALGLPEAATWPRTVELVSAGTSIELGVDFFHADGAPESADA